MAEAEPPGTPPPPPIARAQLQQLFTALTTSLHAKKKKKKRGKKKSVGNAHLPEDTSAASFRLAAAFVPRAIDLFVDMERVLDVGIQVESRTPDDPPLDLDQDDQRHLAAYRELMEFKPVLHQLLGSSEFIEAENGAPFETLVRLLEQGFSNGRSDDTRKLRQHVVTYAIPDGWAPREVPDTSPGASKAGRGFRSELTARMLCPIAYMGEFNANPTSVMQRIESGELRVTAEQLPSFLYPDDHPYDRANLYNGLFKSRVLVRAWRHNFTGPASALEALKKSNGPACLAKVYGLQHVTARTLCYIAAQVHVGLSSLEHWSVIDGNFNLRDFYDSLVRLFEVFKRRPERLVQPAVISDFEQLAAQAV
ncbi:hypothetical protein EIP91_003856 [Steccherinum ochraceum]|uniref:Uncharacterized protein n=1 Tax=Steccherinum ochraceum TaxID=92696 RepID=A0A4R0RB58_9APHY|nr:hypothetical protein EIP91_003856 [Steccherinum ochraceum]